MAVRGCDTLAGARVFWRIDYPDRGEEQGSVYFRYGRPPGHGWVTVYEPDPLRPGCYLLDVRGGGIGGAQWFTVDSAGSVRIFDDNPLYHPALGAR